MFHAEKMMSKNHCYHKVIEEIKIFSLQSTEIFYVKRIIFRHVFTAWSVRDL